jgi:hypothetical protein
MKQDRHPAFRRGGIHLVKTRVVVVAQRASGLQPDEPSLVQLANVGRSVHAQPEGGNGNDSFGVQAPCLLSLGVAGGGVAQPVGRGHPEAVQAHFVDASSVHRHQQLVHVALVGQQVMVKVDGGALPS